MQSNNPNGKSSTSLLSNANTVASTVPLNPRGTPQKDYAAALGDLQSRYGVAATHNPISTPVVKQKDSPQTSTSQSSPVASKGKDTTLSDGEAKKKRILSFLPWIGK